MSRVFSALVHVCTSLGLYCTVIPPLLSGSAEMYLRIRFIFLALSCSVRDFAGKRQRKGEFWVP